MAHIESASITPVVRLLGTRLKEFNEAAFMLKGALVGAAGNMVLRGTPGQNISSWELGFFQFQFSETNTASYRGRTEGEGGARIRNSHQILCRDTQAPTGATLWFIPSAVSRPPSVMPPGGTASTRTLFADEPGTPFLKTVRRTPTAPVLTLYHIDCLMRFCTLLVTRNEAREYVALKHFYWNFQAEIYFQRDGAGQPHIQRVVQAGAHIQGHAHSGLPNDHRFASHFTDPHLPTANNTFRRISAHNFAHPEFTAGWA